MAGGVRSNADFAIVAALAGGDTVAGAAKHAKVAERTVYRRLEDPAFRQQVTAARSEMVARALGGLSAASVTAVRTLLLLMQPTEASSVRLGAAKAVLEIGTRLRESVDLEERIAELEAQQRAREEGGFRPWVA